MVKPYLIDLESVNGTFINKQRMEPSRYYELLEQVVFFSKGEGPYLDRRIRFDLGQVRESTFFFMKVRTNGRTHIMVVFAIHRCENNAFKSRSSAVSRDRPFGRW